MSNNITDPSSHPSYSKRKYYKRIPFLVSMVKSVRSFFRNLTNKPIRNQLAELENLLLLHQAKVFQSNHSNPLNKFGKKCFSQTDEDGITLENISDLTEKGCAKINSEKLDVISLDLDGNDIYFVEKLLADGFKPKLFIVEYNAKFPPPIKFQIACDPEHIWQSDDYYGVSLTSFNDLFNNFGYKLICCNSHTGVNAFFIDATYSDLFSDVPTDINQIYVEPRFHRYTKYGHTQSLRTINSIIK